MKILNLKISNFKNCTKENYTFSPHINGVIGANGVGKTNLLDTIYFLGLTKSRFNLTDNQLITDDTDFFRLDSQIDYKENQVQLVYKKKPNTMKVVEWNKVPYAKLMEHIGKIPVVFIIPDDTRLVADFSDTRRKEIDLVLSQIDKEYLMALMHYNKVLKQRNALLKNYQKTIDPGVMLDYFDTQLVLHGTIIFDKRQAFIESWLPNLKHIYSQLSQNEEDVACTYESSLLSTPLLDDLQRYRDRDIILKRTTAGVHKDDITFTIQGKPLKKFGSQGQMKSFVLAIKLAFYHKMADQLKILPILLLDDIFDKLDYNRVKNLVNLLQEDNYGQIFISDTHRDRLQSILAEGPKDFKLFEIDAGKIKV